jgi:hypothetical protein
MEMILKAFVGTYCMAQDRKGHNRGHVDNQRRCANFNFYIGIVRATLEPWLPKMVTGGWIVIAAIDIGG